MQLLEGPEDSLDDDETREPLDTLESYRIFLFDVEATALKPIWPQDLKEAWNTLQKWVKDLKVAPVLLAHNLPCDRRMLSQSLTLEEARILWETCGLSTIRNQQKSKKTVFPFCSPVTPSLSFPLSIDSPSPIPSFLLNLLGLLFLLILIPNSFIPFSFFYFFHSIYFEIFLPPNHNGGDFKEAGTTFLKSGGRNFKWKWLEWCKIDKWENFGNFW